MLCVSTQSICTSYKLFFHTNPLVHGGHLVQWETFQLSIIFTQVLGQGHISIKKIRWLKMFSCHLHAIDDNVALTHIYQLLIKAKYNIIERAFKAVAPKLWNEQRPGIVAISGHNIKRTSRRSYFSKAAQTYVYNVHV